MRMWICLLMVLSGCCFEENDVANHLVPISGAGGVNLLHDARAIQDSELRWSKNVVPTRSGRNAKRKGSTLSEVFGLISGNVSSGLIANPIPGMRFVTIYHTSVPAIHSVLQVRDTQGTEAEFPFADGSTIDSVFFLPYNDRVLVLTGGEHPAVGNGKIASLDASGFATATTLNFQGVGNDTLRPKVAGVYRHRVVYGNLGAGFENYILFADPYDETLVGDDVTAANGRAIRIGPDDGDEIVALVEITQTEVGSPAQSAFLVLLRKKAFIITGEPNLTTDTGDMLASMVVNRIAEDVGCESANTVARTPHGIIWADHNNVWLFDRGAIPRKVGTKIAPELKHSPAGARFLWHGAYFDGFYRLAVHSETQAVSYIDGSGISQYYPLEHQWWLDLREGSPPSELNARWYGPHIYDVSTHIGTRTLQAVQDADEEDRLYTFAKGALIELEIDSPFDRDIRPIEIEVHSKEYDFGDPMIDKLFQGVELNVKNTDAVTLTVDALIDGGETTQTIQKALSANATTRSSSIAFYPPTPKMGKTIQIQLTSTSAPGDSSELEFGGMVLRAATIPRRP